MSDCNDRSKYYCWKMMKTITRLTKIFIKKKSWGWERTGFSWLNTLWAFHSKTNSRIFFYKSTKSTEARVYMQGFSFVSHCNAQTCAGLFGKLRKHWTGKGAVWLVHFSYWPFGCLSSVLKACYRSVAGAFVANQLASLPNCANSWEIKPSSH